MRRAPLVASLLVAAVIRAPAASAQATAKPGAAAARPRGNKAPAQPDPAKAHLLRGIASYEKGRYAEAVIELETAVATHPVPIGYLILGRCYEKLGDAAKAVDAYSTFVANAPRAMKHSADAAARTIAALRASPGRLQVTSTPSGAEVAVDGAAAGARTPVQIELKPGTHTIHVSAPGHVTEERQIDVAFGSSTTLALDLAESRPTPPAAPGPSDEGPAPPPALRAVRALRPPKIDGIIDAVEWQSAPAVTAFTQKAPLGGRPPSETTAMRVMYDDDAVYIAFDCIQKKSPVVGLLTRRDRPTESDWVSIAFDSYADGRSAYEFAVNAAGVLSDGIRFDDGSLVSTWDEVWEAKTQRREDGWSAELRIPLRALRFEPRPEQAWGFEARRYISALQEFEEWAYVPRDVGGEVSHYGRLEGLLHLEPKFPLELRPFVLGLARYQAPDPGIVENGWTYRASAGLDFKLHLAENVAVDGTINPDFGQVEADQIILNLTTVELLFPEKRPFFLAGMDAFATTVPIFYSRRIGHTPPSPPLAMSALGMERLYDYPQPSQIYGAAKLTAEVGRGWTIAALSAVTGANDVDVVQLNGTRDARRIDPLTSYDVLRVRSQVAPGLDVGAMGTAAVRGEPSQGNVYPVVPTSDGTQPTTQRCPGGELAPIGRRCFHDAYLGSADLVWRSPSGDYAIRGQGFGTAIVNGPTRELPDGTLVSSGSTGAGGILRLSKAGGEHWLVDGTFAARSRELDFNDLGYMDRQNYLRGGAYLEYRTLEPALGLMETHTSGLAYGTNNLEGLALDRGVFLSESVILENRWTLTLGGYATATRYDDREVGDGTALERAGMLASVQTIMSDTRRPLVVWAQATEESLADGGNFYGQAAMTWRPLSPLELQLSPLYTYNYGEPRYAGTGQSPTDLVFGRLHAESASLTLRASYTFGPTVFLQTYAQAFFASGHYFAYGHFSTPATGPRPIVHITDLVPGGAPAINPDFEQGSLAVNVVFFWEYLPGSALYLVYARAQNPSVALEPFQGPRLDFGVLGTSPASDTFMIKLAYWHG